MIKLFRVYQKVEVLYFQNKETRKRYMVDEYRNIKIALKSNQHFVAIYSFYGELRTFSSSEILCISKHHYVTKKGIYRYY